MPVNSVEALKSKYMQVTGDRKVTLAEAEQLISLVKDGGGVTNSERRQLREGFWGGRSMFDTAAQARLDKFINDEIPNILIDEVVNTGGGSGGGVIGRRKDLADPNVLDDDKGKVKFDWTSGTVFKNGADETDVVQGMIGNCYMVAAFGAVAAQNPECIEKAIKDNRDGTYTVTLFDPSSLPYSGMNLQTKKVTVTVDGQLPSKFGLRYGKCADRSELWVGLLEKAFAQWKGGYQSIGHGGSSSNVMSALTGRRGSYTSIQSAGGDTVFNTITAAIKADKAVCAGTFGDDKKAMYSGTGVYADHAYSVLGTEVSGGKKYVVLRNPWGEVEPRGNGADDGIFKMELATFTKLYSGLHVV